MDVFRDNTHAKAQRLLFAAGVAVALVLPIAGIANSADGYGPAVSKPTNSALPRGLDPSIPASGSKRIRVKIFLTDNTFNRALQAQAHVLTAPPAGTAAAKAFAIRNPRRAIPAERVIAARMDRRRNKALSALRRGAASGTRQSERLANYLKARGARIIDASPFPNAITATVPAQLIRSLAARADVISIRNAPQPIWMNSPIDGSETWHVNGYSGQYNWTTQTDGTGGPDYVVVDQGVRVSHQAFNKRKPEDPANGLGTGPSRVTSPTGRTDFSGSQHGNVVASTVAATDLTSYPTTGPPYPANWPSLKGLAYAVDKVYDAYQAQAVSRWVLGLPFNSELGVTDLPEALNYSAGIYEDNVDANPIWFNTDSEVSQYGITNTVSGGNCGIGGAMFYSCYDPNPPFGPMAHRVSTPGNLYNTITVGGLDLNSQPYNSSLWIPWANSSPGPTYGGRKKPDLLATVFPGAGGPVNLNDTDYSNAGTGTSFAAPKAAAGALLLASTGVYTPTAQKAILINTATPIQGQTYWTPTAGWGALNLDGAYYNRGNYANANVMSAGDNGTRFFRQTGVVSGDRTTLVWNRRTSDYFGGGVASIYTVSNLDLFQVDQSTGANTATGGVDAIDTVDTDQTPTAANPIPGNGTDGQDNVEQTRSTASGTQIYKVKAQSSIDGATSEPFAIAGAHPVTALETPIPGVVLSRTPATAAPGGVVTITATVTNPSADLGLTGALVTLSPPAGVSLTAGSLTQSIGTLAANGVSTKSWSVSAATAGLQDVSATASGTTYGEVFSDTATTTFNVDDTPPEVAITAPADYSPTADVPFSWLATDDLSAIGHYDVELARAGGAFTPLLTNTTTTSTAVNGAEGEQLRLRVRATDAAGNTSGWSVHSLIIDAVPVALSVGTPTITAGRISVPVSAINAGSPVTTAYTFRPGGGNPITALSSGSVTYVNPTISTLNPTLNIVSTDGLGRAATFVHVYSVPPSLHNANLKFTRAKKLGRYVLVRGTLTSTATGSVTITAKRTGKTGTKRAKKKFTVSRGRFSGKLKLAKGKYRLTATFSGSRGFASSTVRKNIRVK